MPKQRIDVEKIREILRLRQELTHIAAIPSPSVKKPVKIKRFWG